MKYVNLNGFEFEYIEKGKMRVTYDRIEKIFNEDDIDMLLFFIRENFIKEE